LEHAATFAWGKERGALGMDDWWWPGDFRKAVSRCSTNGFISCSSFCTSRMKGESSKVNGEGRFVRESH